MLEEQRKPPTVKKIKAPVRLERSGKGRITSAQEAKNLMGRSSFIRADKHLGQLSRPTEYSALRTKIVDKWNPTNETAIQYLISKKNIPTHAITAFQELEGYSPLRIKTLFDEGKLIFIGGQIRDR